MVTVLKLGGSVVTRKDRPETVDDDALGRAADLLAESRGTSVIAAQRETPTATGAADLVVVHGGGSFGHHHAERHGVTDSVGSRSLAAVDDVHGAMCRLNEVVVDALRDAGLPAVPVHPFSAGVRSDDGTLTLHSDQVSTLLAEGFCPVLHGDLVAHAGEGVTVLSGDEIVVSLARSLAADRVGLCSTVPGVLDADGAVVPTVESFADVAEALGGSEATDVTGGMAGKVQALLALPAPAWIFDLGDLASFLAGESVGTEVRGE